jgi:HD superfamily phosphodiesterase
MNIRKLKSFISNKIDAEIPKDLTYHGLHHILAVLASCNQYIIRYKIKSKDAYILRTAALVHDIGIIESYSQHEEKGKEFISKELPSWGYTSNDIKQICGLLDATRLPQKPTNLLEQILCDADLDYIGTSKFYEIGDTLYTEFKARGIVSNYEDWNDLQIRFLSDHKFHTGFAQKNREPKKQQNLRELISKKNKQ